MFAECLLDLQDTGRIELDFNFSDLVIMLYYYNTHRKPLDSIDYDRGMTGYSGVLQELISEVPLRGANRKLSVDVNELIPKNREGSYKRKRMILLLRVLQ